MESMRIRTIGAITVPHFTMCDTEVAGYRIPASTMIIVNIWSAHMDPDIWTDPEEFRPERFYSEETGAVINRNLLIPFSLGKRACPGEVLAKQEVFLFYSALLQNFTILPPHGATKVTTDYTITLRPVPFEIRLMARN